MKILATSLYWSLHLSINKYLFIKHETLFLIWLIIRLDVDPRRTPMHPRCRHIGACWDLLEWFQLFGTSQNSISNLKNQTKYKSKFNFEIFWKKYQIFMFPCCSTREDLSIDVTITNVGLISTKQRRIQLFGTSQKFNFKFFWVSMV